MTEKLASVKKSRAEAVTKYTELANTDGVLTAEQETQIKTYETEIKTFDAQIERLHKARDLAASTAQPASDGVTPTVAASVDVDSYTKDKSLILGGIMKMIALSGGNVKEACLESAALYGENHPVTKVLQRPLTRRALNTSVGSSGGFIIPPDYMNEIIELLRPMAQVRAAGPRVIPMPRGTMTLPGQATAAVASYGSENALITASQQSLNQIVASYKKLTALVPVTNDMMRYSDPATDAFVRDDLVKIIALRQDLAFLIGDGTNATPRGYLSFANGYALSSGGTAGNWSSTANSTLAAGGNFVTANENYTLSTVAQEIGGAINKLDTANVPDIKRVWFMHPRSKNYFLNVQNSLGNYVFRDEMLLSKTLLGYPFKTTTQIPVNLFDVNGTNTDCSFIFLAEMDETMILDSMQLELAVSRDGTYVDAGGNTVSAFSNDQTLIRAIAEHDFQLRHDQSVAIIQNVRYAPAIT